MHRSCMFWTPDPKLIASKINKRRFRPVSTKINVYCCFDLTTKRLIVQQAFFLSLSEASGKHATLSSLSSIPQQTSYIVKHNKHNKHPTFSSMENITHFQAWQISHIVKHPTLSNLTKIPHCQAWPKWPKSHMTSNPNFQASQKFHIVEHCWAKFYGTYD